MITARTILEFEGGRFEVTHHEDAGQSCLSFSTGDLGTPDVLVRLHSSCLFGEALGAVDCDCGPQLWAALREMGRAGRGVVTYSYQEGRGAGIVEKIRAMEIQRVEGVNTYEAYRRLGLAPDSRDYSAAIAALQDLGVCRTITLISNNPLKQGQLEAAGFQVRRLVSLPYSVDVRAYEYLKVKRDVGHHIVDLTKLIFVDGRG